MTYTELNELLNKTRRTPHILLTPQQVEEIIKDLEKLEQYEKISEKIEQMAEIEEKRFFENKDDDKLDSILVGKIIAYKDVLNLIESSGVLNDR